LNRAQDKAPASEPATDLQVDDVQLSAAPASPPIRRRVSLPGSGDQQPGTARAGTKRRQRPSPPASSLPADPSAPGAALPGVTPYVLQQRPSRVPKPRGRPFRHPGGVLLLALGGRQYLDATADLNTQMHLHLDALRADRHPSKSLQRAFLRHGEVALISTVLSRGAATHLGALLTEARLKVPGAVLLSRLLAGPKTVAPGLTAPDRSKRRPEAASTRPGRRAPSAVHTPAHDQPGDQQDTPDALTGAVYAERSADDLAWSDEGAAEDARLSVPAAPPIYPMDNEQATPKQVAWLTSFGYDLSPHLSKPQAAALIRLHPATSEQAEALRDLGYPAQTWHWSYVQARELLAALPPHWTGAAQTELAQTDLARTEQQGPQDGASSPDAP